VRINDTDTLAAGDVLEDKIDEQRRFSRAWAPMTCRCFNRAATGQTCRRQLSPMNRFPKNDAVVEYFRRGGFFIADVAAQCRYLND